MSSNLQNLLLNGDFEYGSPPSTWTLVGAGAAVAQEAVEIKVGTYSAKLTRVGNDCHIKQSVHTTKGIDYWKSGTVSLSCWVWASVAARAKITIYDGVDTTSSDLHDGGSDWDFHTITHAINANATELTVKLECITGNTSVYFDGAMLVEGDGAFAYTPHLEDYSRYAWGSKLGTWGAKNMEQIYQADTDGFVFGTLVWAVNNTLLQVKEGAASPPGGTIANTSVIVAGHDTHFMAPIAKGRFWKATIVAGGGTGFVYWIPLGV